jgi:hypothetical protein
LNVFWLVADCLDWFQDSLVHILSGVFAGFLAAFTILTISYVVIWTLRHLYQVKVSSDVVYCILISAFCFGLAFALASHAYRDHLFYLVNRPLGPEMKLIVPK